MNDLDFILGPDTHLGRDLEALRALQLERLRATLDRVERLNPHYREAFARAGVTARDLMSPEDLARFPFTSKTDLRAGYPFGFFCSPSEEIRRVHASSGSTGQPTVVGYSDKDLDQWAELVARSLRAAGARPGMRVHIAYGYGLFTGGLGAHYGAERLGLTVIPVSGGQTERQVRLIRDFAPDVIMVTPSYFLNILDEFRRQGLDPRATSLKIAVLGAEPWTQAMRSEIEQAFNVTAVDIYGLSELMGPGVASEFALSKGGPTVWEDHFYPEIVDPESGEPLPDGERGELALTSLTRQAMPVVRYRTRDLTRLLPGRDSVMRRMEKVSGRSDDMLILHGVNLFPGQIEEILLGLPALSPHYELELTRPARLDHLTVCVEPRVGANMADATAAGRRLAELVKSLIGVSVEVKVCPPGALERSEGKARRVRDLRPA